MSNIQVVKAFKLVDDIDIGLKKYNSMKVFINSNDAEVFFDD